MPNQKRKSVALGNPSENPFNSKGRTKRHLSAITYAENNVGNRNKSLDEDFIHEAELRQYDASGDGSGDGCEEQNPTITAPGTYSFNYSSDAVCNQIWIIRFALGQRIRLNFVAFLLLNNDKECR